MNNYIINLYKQHKISYLTLAHEIGNSKAEIVKDKLINKSKLEENYDGK